MKKSEFIAFLAQLYPNYRMKDVEQATQLILDKMIEVLGMGGRVEIRGFGTFSVRQRNARVGRNPKTGESVLLSEKRVPHFKPGKALRAGVNCAAGAEPSNFEE